MADWWGTLQLPSFVLPTTPEACPRLLQSLPPRLRNRSIHTSGYKQLRLIQLPPGTQRPVPFPHQTQCQCPSRVTNLCLQSYCRPARVGAGAGCGYPTSPATGHTKPTLLQSGSSEQAHQRRPSFESSRALPTGTSPPPPPENQFVSNGTILLTHSTVPVDISSSKTYLGNCDGDTSYTPGKVSEPQAKNHCCAVRTLPEAIYLRTDGNPLLTLGTARASCQSHPKSLLHRRKTRRQNTAYKIVRTFNNG